MEVSAGLELEDDADDRALRETVLRLLFVQILQLCLKFELNHRAGSETARLREAASTEDLEQHSDSVQSSPWRVSATQGRDKMLL